MKTFTLYIWIATILFIIASALLATLYVKHSHVYVQQAEVGSNTTSATRSTGKSDDRFLISDTTISIKKDGYIVQTLTLSDDVIDMIASEEKNPGGINYVKQARFITNQDVNFDGQTDIGLLTGVGYGGVNYFYDYYIFNPITSKLERSNTLKDISNPIIDTSHKTITSSFRSGPQWYTQNFVWDGSRFVPSKVVPEKN